MPSESSLTDPCGKPHPEKGWPCTRRAGLFHMEHATSGGHPGHVSALYWDERDLPTERQKKKREPCDHSTCGWKPRYYGPDGECLHPAKRYTGTLYDGPGGRKTWLFYSCPDCKSSWKDEEKPERRCNGCGHSKGEGCGCSAHTFVSREHCDRCAGRAALKATHDKLVHHETCEDCDALDPCPCCGLRDEREPEDPPLTPEEEEALPPPEGPEYEPCACGHIEPEHAPDAGEGECWADDCECPAYRPESELCVCGDPSDQSAVHCIDEPCYLKPKPPQPDRRPPVAYAYAVQGHLYEVALPGDATVKAVDGALIITHSLGPVAGIVQARPLEGEQS